MIGNAIFNEPGKYFVEPFNLKFFAALRRRCEWSRFSGYAADRRRRNPPAALPRPPADCVNVVGSAVAHFSVVQRFDPCEESRGA